MVSIAFPDMFSMSKTNLIYDHDATAQNLKLLLYSEKGELFGDPYFGAGLKRFMFDQNDIILYDLLVDEIYSTIKLFMPQIKVSRDGITVTKKQNGEISAKIKCVNLDDYTTNLYNIVLLQENA